MDNLTISIFGNKIFAEIINEIKSFTKFKAKFYENLDLCITDAEQNDRLVVFFKTEKNKKDYEKIKKNNFPLIVAIQPSDLQSLSSNDFVEYLNMPFSILKLEKKVISHLARCKFKKSSLINLRGYIINKNERKIIKDGLELQLTEKEINFLILFSKTNKPLSKNFVLKDVWNYSTESETHTLETHIHRLRKKILNKFGDNNFIKNNVKGYYI